MRNQHLSIVRFLNRAADSRCVAFGDLTLLPLSLWVEACGTLALAHSLKLPVCSINFLKKPHALVTDQRTAEVKLNYEIR